MLFFCCFGWNSVCLWNSRMVTWIRKSHHSLHWLWVTYPFKEGAISDGYALHDVKFISLYIWGEGILSFLQATKKWFEVDAQCFFPWSGDQRHRAGLPAAPTPWLPHPSASADAGLLAEGSLGAPSLRWPCQRSGQTDPKPGVSENSGSRRSGVSARLCLYDWRKTCPPIRSRRSNHTAEECHKSGSLSVLFHRVFLCPFGILTISGQEWAPPLPNLMYRLNVLLWPVSLLLFPFPSFSVLPVSWLHTGEDAPPLTNPIVCPCHSLGLRLYLSLLTGMLLRDIYKRLTAVLMTVFVKSSLCVSAPSPRPSYPLLDQRAPQALSSCTSVGEWLRAIKMERYEDSFLQAGINTVDQLAQITTQSVPISNLCSSTQILLLF